MTSVQSVHPDGDDKAGVLEKRTRSGRRKVQGRYRLLAPYRDECGIWRVGGRSRDMIPYTADSKPAILLPEGSRYAKLDMRDAHEVSHVGHEGCSQGLSCWSGSYSSSVSD